MKSSPEFTKIAQALAKAQPLFEVPKKDKSATITPRNGGASFTYYYSDLADVIAAAKPGLAPNGLSLFHVISADDAGRPALETILMHESGEWISMLYPLSLNGTQHETGSALTYARRYSASMILGIASDKDDDAQAAMGASKGSGQGSGQKSSSSGTTTTIKPPQPTIPGPQGGADGSSEGTTTGKPDPLAAGKDRADAIVIYTRWAKKLVAAQTSHPENAAMLEMVKSENSIMAPDGNGANPKLSPKEIRDAARRLMINVCNTTGEVEETISE